MSTPINLSGYTPHDYQLACHIDYNRAISTGLPTLYAAPTGVGKSVMELMCLADDPDAILITPRLEIVAGMLSKCGIDPSGWSDAKFAAEALERRITTPIRLLNMLAAGERPYRPKRLLMDEAHHDLAESWAMLEAYLPGVQRVGWTATPFRGTPKGTTEFLKRWNDTVTWVLNLPQAAERGLISVPRCKIWPLVDDEKVNVKNSEFVASELSSAVGCRLGEVAERCKSQFIDMCDTEGEWNEAEGDYDTFQLWDRPTVFALPSTDNVNDLTKRLNDLGCPAVAVTQDTPRAERNKAFADCIARRVAIVQINVVSEGVDLPIRRVIDLRPTMSPVWWQQMVGRAMRPGGESEYICCNRNLERHAYLMQGLIPAAKVGEAQKAFGAPSARANSRAIGLEAIGRFKAAELPLSDGCIGQMYNLMTFDGFHRTEYAVLVHPASDEPLYAKRVSAAADGGTFVWGRFEKVDSIPDVTGFQSAPAKDLSDKQKAWWNRSAHRYGLDNTAKVNRRAFCALPVLQDLGRRIGGKP